MKKFLKNLTNSIDSMTRKFYAGITSKGSLVHAKLSENEGDFVVNHTVVAVATILLGGTALVMLTAFIVQEMGPALNAKIMDFFN